MVREDLKDKTILIYFETKEETDSWKAEADKAHASDSTYMKEMARRGREAPRSSPSNAQELASLREENFRLKTSEAELRRLYERSEAELFKLRHASFALPADGLQEPSEKLVEVLKAAVRPLCNDDLLRALGIDPRDLAALKLLKGQLQALQDFGLLKEMPMGWRWVHA